MIYNVKNMMFTTICQKCNARPTKVPLIDFLLPNGLLWVPDTLYCPGCGNYVTIQTREMTKDELKERNVKELQESIDKEEPDMDETEDVPEIIGGGKVGIPATQKE